MNIETLVTLDLTDEKSASEVLEAIKQDPTLVKQASKDNGLTALHAAARDGNFKLVLAITTQQFVQKQSLDVQDFSGNTALHLAFANNRWSIVTFLLSQEADKDILNNDGVPACYEQVWKQHFFSKEFSTKVMAKPGASEVLSDYLNEDYVQNENVNKEANAEEVSACVSEGAGTGPGARIEAGTEAGSEEHKRQADKPIVKEKTDPEKDTCEFEDIELSATEMSEAALQTRLAMARKLLDKSCATQAQQFLEGAGIGVLNVYNALSDLAVPGPVSLLSRISIKGYFT